MEQLLNLIGPWFVAVGSILLVWGVLARQLAADASVRKLGSGAAGAGWKLLLLAAALYLLTLFLTAASQHPALIEQGLL